jgi:hypothetical protein
MWFRQYHNPFDFHDESFWSLGSLHFKSRSDRVLGGKIRSPRSPNLPRLFLILAIIP